MSGIFIHLLNWGEGGGQGWLPGTLTTRILINNDVSGYHFPLTKHTMLFKVPFVLYMTGDLSLCKTQRVNMRINYKDNAQIAGSMYVTFLYNK